MKIINILASLLLVLCFACSDSPKRGEPILEEGYEPTPIETTTSTTTTPSTTPVSEPAQNADGVWHYTCPNGCAGGAGSAGPCSVCGATLAHNSAYHNSSVTNVDATPNGTTTVSTGNGAEPSITTTPSAEPAQNAAGVWHYTCPNGCAGGAGSAGPCSACGATLAHNSAYHN